MPFNGRLSLDACAGGAFNLHSSPLRVATAQELRAKKDDKPNSDDAQHQTDPDQRAFVTPFWVSRFVVAADIVISFGCVTNLDIGQHPKKLSKGPR